MIYEQFDFINNDFNLKAFFSKRSIEEIFIPILNRINEAAKSKEQFIVFLAAPPATGKSTLAQLLETLGNQHGIPIQALGLDGFHYPQQYLNTHYFMNNNQEFLLSQVKGSPETYDVLKLMNAIEKKERLWPRYSRQIHDVIEGAIEIKHPILLIEGNWLLLDEEPWIHLQPDMTIFIEAKSELLKNRLIDRKIKGGSSKKEATLFVEQSDLPNIDYVLTHSRSADIMLRLTEEYDYID